MNYWINLLPNIYYSPNTFNSRVIWVDAYKLILIFTSFKKSNKGCAILFSNVEYFKRSMRAIKEENIDTTSKIGVLYEIGDADLVENLFLDKRKKYKHFFLPTFLEYKIEIVANDYKLLDDDLVIF